MVTLSLSLNNSLEIRRYKPKALSDAEIWQTISDFAKSAELAKQAGSRFLFLHISIAIQQSILLFGLLQAMMVWR